MARITTVYNDFAKDIESYLVAKLPPDTSGAVAKEIATYISYKCSILVSDLFVEQVRRDKMDAARYRNRAIRTHEEMKGENK